MKGLVFTTFYEYCEEAYGPRFLDELIDAARLANDGAFTAVGTYPFSEMQKLVAGLAVKTGRSPQAVLESFGTFCFSSWVSRMPEAFEGRTLFDILSSIDDFHENEIRKLYPDAELPTFRVENRSDNRLILAYRSEKPLSDLAMGVINGVAAYVNECIDLVSEQVVNPNERYVRITVTRAA